MKLKLKRMGCCQSGRFWIQDENGDPVAVIPAGASGKQERETADLICRAVNSHDALVEALRLAIDTIESLHGHFCPNCKGDCPDLETISIARAALEKAGAA